MTQPSTAYRVYGQWMFTTGDDGWTLVRVLRLCDVGPVVYDALHATIFGEWIRSWRPEEPGRWNMAQAFATDGCPVFGRLPSASVWWSSDSAARYTAASLVDNPRSTNAERSVFWFINVDKTDNNKYT